MFGIDIGSYSVKAAVVKKTARGVATIEQIASEVLPEALRDGAMQTADIRHVVTRLIKKVGKGQNRVALSIPTASVILQSIDVDAGLTESLLAGEVQMAMVDFVPFPLEQVYADYISLGQSTKDPEKEEIFIVASRKDMVNKVANAVDDKLVRKKEVEVEAFALGQVIEQIKGHNYRGTYAIIDIGYKSTIISVFKAGHILFNRGQQIGGHHLTEAIAEASGISVSEAEKIKLSNIHSIPNAILVAYLEALNEQLGLALELFSSTNTEHIDTVYITGGGSLLPNLLENVKASQPGYNVALLPIGQEISIGQKTHGLTVGEIGAYAAVVSGLALRT